MLESQNILAMTTSTKQAEIDSAQNAVDTLMRSWTLRAALSKWPCHVDLRKQLASASLGSEFRIRRVSDPTGPMRLLITSTSSSSLRTWRNPRCNKRSILRRLVESLFNMRQ